MFIIEMSNGNGRFRSWHAIAVNPKHPTLESALYQIDRTGGRADWVRVVNERGKVMAAWDENAKWRLPWPLYN